MSARLPILLIILILSLVYKQTLAPTITWANYGADSGGLVSAVYTGGVAHPPGYPLYLNLAWLVTRILPGEIALRTNLLSALFAILAAVCLYSLLRRLAIGPIPATLGALSLGLAPAIWAQAVITEIYTLQLLLVTLIFWQMSWLGRETVSDLLRGLVFGLALSNHATSLFLAPVLLTDSTPGQRPPALRALLRFGIAGLTASALYASLLLRGIGDSPVNWGKVTNLARLWWLVSGQAYRDYLSAPDLAQKLPFLWAELLSFGPGLLLVLLALVLLPGLPRFKRLTLAVAALYITFALAYNTRDWQVNLLTVFFLAAFWFAVGLDRLPARLWPARQRQLRLGLFLLALLGLGWNTFRAWPLVDASSDTRAADFAETILAEVPPQSLIFTNADQDTFSLWYYHYALGQRPDVAIMPSGMLEYDWLRENLRITYPDLLIPDQAEHNFRQSIIQANPNRPVCSIFFEPQTALICR